MRVVATAIALVVLVGCSEDCGDLDCGAGLVVYWRPGQVPADVAQVRVCDDDCMDAATPTLYPGRGFYFVDGSGGPGEQTVTLDLLADDGSVIRSLVGRGRASGGKCACKNLSMRIADDGQSLEVGSLDELYGLD